MSKTTTKSIFYFFIIVLMVLLVFLPRGSTVDDAGVKIDANGEVFGQLKPDSGILSQLADKLPSLYRQQMSKSDYGFVAFYNYSISVDLEQFPKISQRGFKIKAELPGSIKEVQGGGVEGGQAVFNLKLGQKNNLNASSTLIRWHWITVALFSALMSMLFYFLLRTPRT